MFYRLEVQIDVPIWPDDVIASQELPIEFASKPSAKACEPLIPCVRVLPRLLRENALASFAAQ